MLKTKKDIFKWYLSRGNLDTKKSDYDNFIYHADKDIYLVGIENNILKIMTKRSKYPVYLYFSINEYNVLECYKISGY